MYRYLEGQSEWHYILIFKVLKEKYLQPEYLPSKIIIQNWKRDKVLLRQAKIKTVHQHKTNPEINVRGSSLNRKENRICGRGRIPLVKTLAKIWKQTKCSSTDNWIEERYYIHTCMHTHAHRMGYYSVTKKNEKLLFATLWMDFWGNVLSKISQIRKRERQILCNIICM